MGLLESIRMMVETMENHTLRNVVVLIHCTDKGVDFQADPISLNFHTYQEVGAVHADSDDIIDLPVTKHDRASGQDTPLSIIVDMSNAQITSDELQPKLKLVLSARGEVQSIDLDLGVEGLEVHD